MHPGSLPKLTGNVLMKVLKRKILSAYCTSPHMHIIIPMCIAEIGHASCCLPPLLTHAFNCALISGEGSGHPLQTARGGISSYSNMG